MLFKRKKPEVNLGNTVEYDPECDGPANDVVEEKEDEPMETKKKSWKKVCGAIGGGIAAAAALGYGIWRLTRGEEVVDLTPHDEQPEEPETTEYEEPFRTETDSDVNAD